LHASTGMQALLFRLHGYEYMCNVFAATLQVTFTSAELEAG